MSKNLINHKHCPNCDVRIKHYYSYCVRCGNNDIVNWKLTGYFWLIAGAFFLIVIYFVTKNFCSNPFFMQIEFCRYL